VGVDWLPFYIHRSGALRSKGWGLGRQVRSLHSVDYGEVFPLGLIPVRATDFSRLGYRLSKATLRVIILSH